MEEENQRTKEKSEQENMQGLGPHFQLEIGDGQKTEFEKEIKPQRSAQHERKPAECKKEAPSWMNQFMRK